MTYNPATRRGGDATPQSEPELFTDADIMKEVRYLIRTNKRHGEHPLRTAAYMRMLAFIADRKAGNICENCNHSNHLNVECAMTGCACSWPDPDNFTEV